VQIIARDCIIIADMATVMATMVDDEYNTYQKAPACDGVAHTVYLYRVPITSVYVSRYYNRK
jgi:hypothetical protein